MFVPPIPPIPPTILKKIPEILISIAPAAVELIRNIFKEDKNTNEKIRKMKHYNREDNSVSQLQNLILSKLLLKKI